MRVSDPPATQTSELGTFLDSRACLVGLYPALSAVQSSERKRTEAFELDMILLDRLPTTLLSSAAVPGSYCAETNTIWWFPPLVFGPTPPPLLLLLLLLLLLPLLEELLCAGLGAEAALLACPGAGASMLCITEVPQKCTIWTTETTLKRLAWHDRTPVTFEVVGRIADRWVVLRRLKCSNVRNNHDAKGIAHVSRMFGASLYCTKPLSGDECLPEATDAAASCRARAGCWSCEC